ncbi:MAG: hypothetical protein HY549_00785 [Elusimicrobia bacterium]|nr:hypothetical protein [Elusimicrobiota bacterium]
MIEAVAVFLSLSLFISQAQAGRGGALGRAEEWARSLGLETQTPRAPLPVSPGAPAPSGIRGELLQSFPVEGSESIFNRHLLTGLRIAAKNGAVYSLSMQSWRPKDGGEETAYLVFYRPGMAKPKLINVRDIACVMFCGDGTEVKVEPGVSFHARLKPNLSQGEESLIYVTAPGGAKKEFSVKESFLHTGGTARRFKVRPPKHGEVEVGVVYYEDFPVDRDPEEKSIAFMIGDPYNEILPVHFEKIPSDGKVLTGSLGGRKFGVRVFSGRLELYEIRGEGQVELPGELPVRSLMKWLESLEAAP